MKKRKTVQFNFYEFSLYISIKIKRHRKGAPTLKILMFLDSAAKNYPGILRDQNKYATFLFWLTLLWLGSRPINISKWLVIPY